jgi:hypothetical protein
MKLNRIIKKEIVSFAAINLLLIGLIQTVHAGAATNSNFLKRCVNRSGLTFNGVGLWTRLPTVLERYGQPLRKEPIPANNNLRAHEHYYYKDIKLVIYNSRVWQIDVLTAGISTKSGVHLLSDLSKVEHILGIKLKDPNYRKGNRAIHSIPICPPDPPEVEEYVILSFDQSNRLVEFTVMGVFP